MGLCSLLRRSGAMGFAEIADQGLAAPWQGSGNGRLLPSATLLGDWALANFAPAPIALACHVAIAGNRA